MIKYKKIEQSREIKTNIGTTIKALVNHGKIEQDYSIYKRIKDVRNVWRITRFSDSWLNAYRPR